jgi:hypothetical protein
VQRTYPEIDIYVHAKTIAQSRASKDASWLMLQLTENVTLVCVHEALA